jgi:hypothetical protein
MQRLPIGFGVDCDRLDAEFTAGAYDADCDLTAVCD